LIGPVKAVTIKKNEDEKIPHDYCFVRFMTTESVQKALSHPKKLIVNDVEL